MMVGWSVMAALDLILRASLVLLLGAVLVRTFERRAASDRQLLWTCTFGLILALPLAVQWLPTLHLTIPTGPRSRLWERVQDGWAWLPGLADGGALRALWLGGSMLVLLGLALGWVRFVVWVRNARPLDPSWSELTETLRTRLAIDRPVRVLLSDAVATPVLGGIWRPTVLLPAGADRWSEERRAAVLAHELMHVQRRDVLRQWVGGLALTVYWFHPLAWLAVRWSALLREKACDEGVLRLGLRPSVYAGHLLALAQAPRQPVLSPGLALIRRSQLEQRIASILRSRRPQAQRSMAWGLCLVLALGAVAAAISTPITAADAHALHCPLPNPIPD